MAGISLDNSEQRSAPKQTGSCVRSCMLHGSETWPARRENEGVLSRAEMRMIWLDRCVQVFVKLSDKVACDELTTERQVGIGGCCDSIATQLIEVVRSCFKKG